MRQFCVLILIVTHALCIAFATKLPEPVAPVVAGSIYLPLWPLHALGLPVFAAAESGGWSAPNLLGWILVGLLWCCIWWALVRFAFWLYRARG